MAFRFFKEKQSGPREIACPLCEHRQMESPLAVSSYCQNCGAYLSFEKGKIKARPKMVEDPFKYRPPQPKVEIEYKPREESLPPPPERPPAPAPKVELKTPPEARTEDIELIEPDPKPVPSSPFEKSSPDIQTRTAVCFDCGDSHEANALANSTQCRKCGRMISMESFDIRGVWNINVRTRGDVFIHRKSLLDSHSIECHDMTVEGEFSGDVTCTGDLILRRNAKILGKIICKRLLIEKRARIDFRNTIQTEECRIDGSVLGNIVCRGDLTLDKKATLNGDIKVGNLVVGDGAKHVGQIQMGGF